MQGLKPKLHDNKTACPEEDMQKEIKEQLEKYDSLLKGQLDEKLKKLNKILKQRLEKREEQLNEIEKKYKK